MFCRGRASPLLLAAENFLPESLLLLALGDEGELAPGGLILGVELHRPAEAGLGLLVVVLIIRSVDYTLSFLESVNSLDLTL